MTISEIKALLATVETVAFKLPSGAYVPSHFHVTEVGIVTKNFIDCGGTVRNEKVASLQLWNANDVDHRLKPNKLMDIISLSEKILGMEDLDIEVEYQSDTIGKYALDFNGEAFELIPMQTDCLAKDQCGISPVKQKINVAEVAASCCTPGGGCC